MRAILFSFRLRKKLYFPLFISPTRENIAFAFFILSCFAIRINALAAGRRKKFFCGAAGREEYRRIQTPVSGCQKTSLGGLEGRSPPNAIRIRRHVRRIRKPCTARFPCAVSRPGAPRGREGNSVKIRKRTPQADFFDTLTGGFRRRSVKAEDAARSAKSAPLSRAHETGVKARQPLQEHKKCGANREKTKKTTVCL